MKFMVIRLPLFVFEFRRQKLIGTCCLINSRPVKIFWKVSQPSVISVSIVTHTCVCVCVCVCVCACVCVCVCVCVREREREREREAGSVSNLYVNRLWSE